VDESRSDTCHHYKGDTWHIRMEYVEGRVDDDVAGRWSNHALTCGSSVGVLYGATWPSPGLPHGTHSLAKVFGKIYFGFHWVRTVDLHRCKFFRKVEHQPAYTVVLTIICFHIYLSLQCGSNGQNKGWVLAPAPDMCIQPYSCNHTPIYRRMRDNCWISPRSCGIVHKTRCITI
jgi:hypothetical protein